MTHFFIYKELTLHYKQWGTGNKAILAFHGFGQSCEAFALVASTLGPEYTLYSFDLPFHGKSTWHSGEKPINNKFWTSCIAVFLEQQKRTKFGMLGFSIGAKFIIPLIESFYDRIESITLLAPDGITTNVWYRLATYPVLTRKIFKSLISNPAIFFQLTSIAYRTGLINKSVKLFAESQMNSEEKRKQVYYSWVVFRQLHGNSRQVAGILNTHAIPLTLVMGRHDTIITTKTLQRFLLLLHPKPELILLDKSHHQLINGWAASLS